MMECTLEDLNVKMNHIYERNPFLHLLGITFVTLQQGGATLSMPIIADRHSNYYGVAHGGVLCTLADTAMGVACSTYGDEALTMEMNINLLKSAQPGMVVYAFGKVLHRGRNTIVAEAEVRDENDKLLAKARGTFFVVAHNEDESKNA